MGAATYNQVINLIHQLTPTDRHRLLHELIRKDEKSTAVALPSKNREVHQLTQSTDHTGDPAVEYQTFTEKEREDFIADLQALQEELRVAYQGELLDATDIVNQVRKERDEELRSATLETEPDNPSEG